MLRKIHAAGPKLPVIVMTAHSDLGNAVSAYRERRVRVPPKPFDIDQVVELVRARRAVGQRSANVSGAAGAGSRAARPRAGDAAGVPRDRPAVALQRDGADHRRVGQPARNSWRRAARHSPRANKPFIALNTSAIHGSCSSRSCSATRRARSPAPTELRRGRFEQADGGTLFLDEIGDMSPPLQTRLLRVLAEGEFYRVGGQLPVKVDRAVIAATHQNLEPRVLGGLFHEDLFHRLNVIRIEVPPLRQRREDIPTCCSTIRRGRGRTRRAPKTLTDDARASLVDIRLARQRACS